MTVSAVSVPTSPQRGEVGSRVAMRSIVQCDPGEGPQRSVGV